MKTINKTQKPKPTLIETEAIPLAVVKITGAVGEHFKIVYYSWQKLRVYVDGCLNVTVDIVPRGIGRHPKIISKTTTFIP